MNDELSELIRTVFDALESLDQAEFEKVLSAYYEDPLTNLLAASNKFDEVAYESPYIPFVPAYHRGELWDVKMPDVGHYEQDFTLYVSGDGPGNIAGQLFSIWSADLLGKIPIGRITRAECQGSALSDWTTLGIASNVASDWTRLSITDNAAWTLLNVDIGQDYLWASGTHLSDDGAWLLLDVDDGHDYLWAKAA